MKHGALLVLGIALLAGGPVVPGVVGGGRALSQLFDLGADGAGPRRSFSDVEAAVRAPLSVKKLGTSLVEIAGPSSAEKELGSVVKSLERPITPAPTCADCFDARVHAHPLFNRAAGPIGGARHVEKPAPRPLWLLGMALGLVGLGLLVLALQRLRGMPSLPVMLVVGALAGGATGAGNGMRFSDRVQQVLIVRPTHRPLLPEQPVTTDRVLYTQDVAGWLASADMRDGLGIEVTATPDNADVVAHVEARDPNAIDAFSRRVEERMMGPFKANADSFKALLDEAPPDSRAVADVMRTQLVMPELTRTPIEPDGRGPLKGGIAGALAGVLVMFAAAWRRKSA